jgi:tetratricopeptide (TPR) repeat protein
MSNTPLKCDACSAERQFDRIAPFPDAANEQMFAVAWRCPSCDTVALDLCPCGPLVPTDSSCLSCGAEYPSTDADPVCPGCGMPRSEARTFLGLDGDIPAVPVAAALLLFEQGLHRRGLALLNHTLQHDPQNAEAWREKAVFLQSLGYYTASLEPLRRAIAAGAASELRISLGVALQETGQLPEAVAAYEELVSQCPDSEWLGVALCNEANALAQLGKDEQAEDRFKAALRAEPRRSTHHFNYHLLLARQRRWDDTLGVLQLGLSHLSDEDALRVTLLAEKAWVLAELDRGEESLEAAEAALALSPENLKARYMRGRALASIGRLDDARSEMERVLAAQPDHADARQAVKMLDDALAATRKPRRWWNPFS